VILDRRSHGGTGREPGVQANARLTGYTSIVLFALLAVEGLTVLSIRRLLVWHALIGFLLVPPVLLKLASVGYRFARYYTRHPHYRAAGPPDLVLRLLGPVVVLLTIVLFVTGIELWLFGFRFGFQWLVWHKLAFVLWFFAMAVHVLGHLARAPRLAVADWQQPLAGALTRRSLVVGSVLLGIVLAIAMAPYPTPFIAVGDVG
jgi:hypothetical protein